MSFYQKLDNAYRKMVGWIMAKARKDDGLSPGEAVGAIGAGILGGLALGGLLYLLATKKCPRCGKRNPNEEHYCRRCGGRFP